jgi:signal peptidase II
MQSLLQYSIRHRLILGLLTSFYALDQVSKYVVSQSMKLGESVPAEGLFRLTFIYNSGSAFGLFRGMNAPLILVSLIGVTVLVFVYRTQPHPSWLWSTSLGLQLAGALGNLTDRLTLGHVVDFIDVGSWPIFNVADASLIVGMALLGWIILVGRTERQSPIPDDLATAAEATTVAGQEPSLPHEHRHP